MKQQRGVKKYIFPVFFVTLIVTLVSFGTYVSMYYHAAEPALAVLQEPAVTETDRWYALEAEDSDVGFIFYPGAKVEAAAYLPLMHRLQQEGISCYLVKMPFNLAFFGSGLADAVMAEYQHIDTWYMGGHSLGGAFASSYAAGNQEQVAGVALLGAYVYGGYPVERSITIYGSEDLVLSKDKITYNDNIHVLDGGNHAQFGDYGAQKGDGAAAMTAEEQLAQTVQLLQTFMLGA